ncbi:MAG TPA: CRISPR-associated protein Cas4 [Ruminiclostridium sp.]|nr:CRISPR-associated protein Cas4 [Ruminiclostridium sp.]
MYYDENDFLSLSGIQHFAFCRRQWALIHIEQQWSDNLRTVEGEILHDRAHDDYFNEKRGSVIISRGMPIFSHTLGARGICDIVELHESKKGINISGREGLYLPVPVEYKRGKPKETDEDLAQLAAQTICLEEMLACKIPQGYLYYGETKHRIKAALDAPLRERVIGMFTEMHEMYDRRYTPKVKTGRQCRACSLAEICLPKLCKNKSAAAYIRGHLEENGQ